MKYDYLIVGSGLFGAVFARRATDAGKSCLILEKRVQSGGNVYCENKNGIVVHSYGPHIFHTNSQRIWDFVNALCEFHLFVNSPLARYNDEYYHLPFNMNTFHEMWGVETPEEAQAIIEEQRRSITVSPRNLEEQAISLVGTDIYEKLIRHYTEKQWGRPCSELPAFIIKRLPVRFVYNNNYFNDKYQGIPVGGYNTLISALLEGSEVLLQTDFNDDRDRFKDMAKTVVYTGTIDSYFDYCLGRLEYRSLRFETEALPIDSFQGNAVVNYTDAATPFTRIIEHKFFEDPSVAGTVITREYPVAPSENNEPFYPINDDKNTSLYEAYRQLAEKEKGVYFGGRLAEYKYYNMDQVIESSLELADKLI